MIINLEISRNTPLPTYLLMEKSTTLIGSLLTHSLCMRVCVYVVYMCVCVHVYVHLQI